MGRACLFLLLLTGCPLAVANGDVWLWPDLQGAQGYRWRVMPVDECESLVSLLAGLKLLDAVGGKAPACLTELEKKQSELSAVSPRGSYELLRLAALHVYWQKNKKGSDSDFCAWSAEQQNKDDLFFRGREGYQRNAAWRELAFGGERWKLVEEYGLTEGEYSAVRSYTDQFYEEINQALRKGPLPEPLRVFDDSLRSALRKLPPYYGVVHRGSNLPPEILAEHEPGKIVTYAAYTSTSKNADWDSQSWGKNVFNIDSNGVCRDTAGIYIAEVSEVDCPAGTRFEVLSRKPLPKGGFEFEMKALPAD